MLWIIETSTFDQLPMPFSLSNQSSAAAPIFHWQSTKQASETQRQTVTYRIKPNEHPSGNPARVCNWLHEAKSDVRLFKRALTRRTFALSPFFPFFSFSIHPPHSSFYLSPYWNLYLRLFHIPLPKVRQTNFEWQARGWNVGGGTEARITFLESKIIMQAKCQTRFVWGQHSKT